MADDDDHSPEEPETPPAADLSGLPVVRSFEALIEDVSPGSRTVVAKINTAGVDRFRTVIDAAGARLDNYRRNPVVLWEHGKDPVRGSMPIGRNLWVKARKAERDLIAKTQFGEDDYSRALFSLYQDETLRGFSVQFAPDFKASAPTAAECRARPELTECKAIIRSWDLVEYSATATPANADALALAVSRGLWVPADVRSSLPVVGPAPMPVEAPGVPVALPPFPSGPILPPFVGRSLDDVLGDRLRALRAEAEDVRARLELRRGKV